MEREPEEMAPDHGARRERGPRWEPVAAPWWIERVARAQGLTARPVAPDELDACRRLLHRVYHDERGWSPEPGNPSGLRVHPGPPAELRDDYDADALWLGVYRRAQLCACVRVILPDPRRPIEAALYHDLPAALLDGAMEVNRLAILPAERRGLTFALVALLLLWTGRRHGVRRALVAAEEPLSRKLYRPLGWRFTGVRFRYRPTDPHACEVLTIEPTGAAVLLAIAMTLGRSALRVLGSRA